MRLEIDNKSVLITLAVILFLIVFGSLIFTLGTMMAGDTQPVQRTIINNVTVYEASPVMVTVKADEDRCLIINGESLEGC